MKRWLALTTTLALLITLVPASWRPVPAGAQTGPAGRDLAQLSDDAFDQAFLTQMISHHAMAVQMARPAATSAVHAETQSLARGIVADQTREIAQMRVWLKAWYNLDVLDPLAPTMGGMDSLGHQMPGHSMGDQPAPIGGMDMSADLATLPAGRLEVVFLSLMIPHHQGAVEMAKLVPDRAAHQELRELAATIISTQSVEIEQMNNWLSSWYGL